MTNDQDGVKPLYRRPARSKRQRAYEPYTAYSPPLGDGDRPIVLYLRLSRYHADGADAIERQRIDLHRKLLADGRWKIVGEFVDNDSASVSAIRERAGWKALNEAIAAKEVRAVGFWKLDRTNRIATQIIGWLAGCRSAGVELVSHQDSDEELNEASANAKLLTGIKALFAEIETDTMSVRQKAAHRHLAEAGFFNGGNPPFGFTPGARVTDDFGRTGVRLEPHPVEFPALQMAVRMVLEGASLNAVAEAWASQLGVVSAHGKPLRAANIRRYLNSPAMLGYRVSGTPQVYVRGQRVDKMAFVVRDDDGRPIVACEPVCDIDTWERMRDAIASRQTVKTSGWVHEWPLTGLLRCPGCGRGLYGGSKSRIRKRTGERVTRKVYRCHTNARKMEPACPAGVTLDADQATAYVLGWLRGYVTKERLDAARSRLQANRGDNQDQSLRKQLSDARVARQTLLARHESGQFTGALMGTFLDLLAKEQARIEALEKQLRPRVAVGLPSTDGTVIVDAWPSMTVDQKRSVLGLVIDRIEVSPAVARVDARLTVVPRASLRD